MVARGVRRVAHLQRTDPGGAWVADAEGEIVGIALALVREGIWGLSLFAVARGAPRPRDRPRAARGVLRPRRRRARPPDPLDREPGRDAALRPPRPRPAPVRRRRRDRRPRRGSPPTDGVVDAGPGGDRRSRTRSAAPSAARGTASTSRSRLDDPARALLLVEDRAFAVVRDERIMLLAGLDDAAATRVAERRARRDAARRDGQRRLPHRRPGLGGPRVPRRGARPLPRRPVLHRRRPRAAAAVRPERGVPVSRGRPPARPRRRSPSRAVRRGYVRGHGRPDDGSRPAHPRHRPARRAALPRPGDRQPHARRRRALDLRRGGEPRPADRVVARSARA